MKTFLIIFVISYGVESKLVLYFKTIEFFYGSLGQSLWSCNVSLCASAPSGNGCSGATTCYSLNTSSGSSVCAPAPPCSLFDVCTNSGSGCPSTKSVCVVNACCSTPVCIPLSLTDMCSITTTTVAPTTTPSTSSNVRFTLIRKF